MSDSSSASSVQADWPSIRPNPFPGLRPFSIDESHLFYGRDQEVYELLRKLRLVHFVAVLGPSGCGKSSLMKAGVLAALRDGYMVDDEPWRLAEFRPGGAPIRQLVGALLAALGPIPGGRRDEASIAADLRAGTLDIPTLVQSFNLRPGTRVLILADQFEEIFEFVNRAQTTDAADEAKAFLKALIGAAATEDSNVYVVMTMRSEYLGQCATYVGLADAINAGLYLVPQMTRQQFRQAIIEPIAAATSSISAPLLDRLLNDLNNRSDQLPVLQHALSRMWAGKKAGEPLVVADYERIGDLSTCLSRHAEEIFLRLSTRQREIAEAMFRALAEVTPGNRIVRRPSSVATIIKAAKCEIADLRDVVDEFRMEGRSFLVASTPALAPETILDLSHEALARQWRRLRTWVEDEGRIRRVQSQLEDTALSWHDGQRDKSFFYRGLRLVEADRLFGAAQPDRISALAQQFLLASRREQRAQRIRKITAYTAVTLVVAGLLGYEAFRRAELLRTEARQSQEAALRSQEEAKKAEKFALDYGNGLTDASTLPQTTLTQVQQKASAIFSPRVTIHIRDESQRDRARALQKRLISQSIEVPSIETVPVAPRRTDVRYFLPSDADEAERIVQVVRDAGEKDATPSYLTAIKGHDSIRPRSFEVWFAAPQSQAAAVRPAPRELDTPKLISPANDVVFDQYPRNTKLQWTAVDGAASYTVEVDCLYCCSQTQWCADVGRPFRIVPNIVPTVDSPEYTFDFVGAQPGRWRVWAVSVDGKESQKSEWRVFRYTR